MKFIRCSRTAQFWAPDGRPVPPVLSHWATVCSAVVPLRSRSARRELAVREGRHVLAEIERLACGDQPQDGLGEGGVPGAVEHLTDVVGQPVDQVPRFGCREVADDVPFDHLLQGVGDRPR